MLLAAGGNGDGTFQSGARIEIRGGDVQVADFNRDGRSDLAVFVGSNYSGTISIFPGQGDGTFGAPAQTAAEAWAILAADFNRDGLPDILTSTAVVLGKGDSPAQFGSDELDEPDLFFAKDDVDP